MKSSLVRQLASVLKVDCKIGRRPRRLQASLLPFEESARLDCRKPGRLLRSVRKGWILSALAVASCGGGDDDQSSAKSNEPGSGGNGRPTLQGSAPPQVLVGKAFEFVPSASDPDGDVLTFSIENLPSWASFDPSTGRVSGTPTDADLGTYAGIRLSVTDGEASASLGPFTVTVVGASPGSATVSWTPPSQKTDGSPLTLAGYKIYWGTASRSYTNSVTVDSPGTATYVIDDLTPATWYFAVTAIDAQGIESDYSNEASKQIL